MQQSFEWSLCKPKIFWLGLAFLRPGEITSDFPKYVGKMIKCHWQLNLNKHGNPPESFGNDNPKTYLAVCLALL